MATSAGATRPADQITFAHNSERQFARLLDFYRVEWEYEPTAFPIEWDAAGQPTQRFCPDFYLPAFGLYIEITTLNQRLVTKKNRKVRRLRELYPDVRIKVLYQRDYLSLLAKYGLEPPSQMLAPAAAAPGAGAAPGPEAGAVGVGQRPAEPAGTTGAGRDRGPGQPAGTAGPGRDRRPGRPDPGRDRPGGRGRDRGEWVGRWSGHGRLGGRGWCPTRRGRCRRCPPTPSSSVWPRCSSRPSGPTTAAPPPPSAPADHPVPDPATAGCRRRRVAALRRAVVQSPRPRLGCWPGGSMNTSRRR